MVKKNYNNKDVSVRKPQIKIFLLEYHTSVKVSGVPRVKRTKIFYADATLFPVCNIRRTSYNSDYANELSMFTNNHEYIKTSFNHHIAQA
jgi:hypothetical protein